jgi:hypothetical protein
MHLLTEGIAAPGSPQQAHCMTGGASMRVGAATAACCSAALLPYACVHALRACCVL